jgi:hypothetical protein
VAGSSTVGTFCDAMAADLTANIPDLAQVETHLYLPVPEDDMVLDGDMHLGVWVLGDSRRPITNDAHERVQVFQVKVWQGAAESGARVAQDPAADLAFTVLYDAVVARIYHAANQWLGGMELAWATTGDFGSSNPMVRAFRINVEGHRYQAFTP